MTEYPRRAYSPPLRFDGPNVLVTGHLLFEQEHTAWKALINWLWLHRINPNLMPADNVITRYPESSKITYMGCGLVDGADWLPNDGQPREADLVKRADGSLEVVVRQGEAPPLPWPDEVVEAAAKYADVMDDGQ